MSFEQFVNQAWADHATQPAQVAGRFDEALVLVEKNEQIPGLAQLITHVYGEHLGEWDAGVRTLEKLMTISVYDPKSESQKAIARSIASLNLASGTSPSMDDLSLSDRIRVYAAATSALAGQKESGKALALFTQTLEMAKSGLDQTDPANRALAITGNNLASALEEKSLQTKNETDLMLLAAETARKYWEIAGTWLEVERAEYRLAQSYMKANLLDGAIKHAQACLEIIQMNSAPALEHFFGNEVLALVEHSRKNSAAVQEAFEQVKINFDKLSVDDKPWCEETLSKLSRILNLVN